MTTIQFLAEWALRSSILIVSGALLLWALRVKDPSIRWAAWTAMLCASLAIPALTVALPKLPLVVMRVAPARIEAPVVVYHAVPEPMPAAPRPDAGYEEARRQRFQTLRLGACRGDGLRSCRPRASAAPVLRPGDEPASAAQQPGDRPGDGRN